MLLLPPLLLLQQLVDPPVVQTEVFKYACKRVGVADEDLEDRSVEYFRPRPAITLRRAELQ